MLSPTLGPNAWNVHNIITHVIVPLLSIIDFFIVGQFGFSNELPFMGCMWWIIAIFVFLIVIGLLYLWILDLIKKNHSKK